MDPKDYAACRSLWAGKLRYLSVPWPLGPDFTSHKPLSFQTIMAPMTDLTSFSTPSASGTQSKMLRTFSTTYTNPNLCAGYYGWNCVLQKDILKS